MFLSFFWFNLVFVIVISSDSRAQQKEKEKENEKEQKTRIKSSLSAGTAAATQTIIEEKPSATTISILWYMNADKAIYCDCQKLNEWNATQIPERRQWNIAELHFGPVFVEHLTFTNIVQWDRECRTISGGRSLFPFLIKRMKYLYYSNTGSLEILSVVFILIWKRKRHHFSVPFSRCRVEALLFFPVG